MKPWKQLILFPFSSSLVYPTIGQLIDQLLGKTYSKVGQVQGWAISNWVKLVGQVVTQLKI